MPASDLLWSSAQGQAFQLYGTKRKSSSCDQEECHMTDVSMDGSGDCKRRCLERIEPEGLEVNHNDPQLNSLQHAHTFTQTQIMPSFPHKLEQVQESPITMASSPPQRFISVQQYYGGPQFCQVETTPHEVDKYPAHSTAETNMVMDLCDETYSVITESPPSARDMEEAHNQMASDFTPNQQQYRNNSLAFCAPNCIVDGPSPTSRVRCYCKPNWDGMMDARPYVSDYY